MTTTISVIISCLALVISAVTAWSTLLRKGTIKMTQPTVVFFGPDGQRGLPKVFLRTLLFSTSRRGQIVESVFVRLRRRESVQAFNVWVYGGDGSSLVRGSGLFVGHEGVAHNHHFLLAKDGTKYEFLPGEYQVEAFAKLVNESKSKMLWHLRVNLSEQQAKEMRSGDAGVYFDWGSDSQSYQSHIDRRPFDEALGRGLFGVLEKSLKGKNK